MKSFRSSAVIAFVLFAQIAFAAEWQWSVPMESVVSGETNDHPRAFLWIPPDCQRVRGVVLGQHNMEEEPIFENPKFRAALAGLGFAEVWITPGVDLGFDADSGVGAHFDAVLDVLALESGYRELATAPVVPIGHSASASFPWRYAAWNPERTLAVLSVSGQWPFFDKRKPPVHVPGLVTIGDYEAAVNRIAEGLKQRAEQPWLPLSMVAEMGGGHFDASDRKVEFLALYLKKAAEYRLGPEGKLKPIDPTRQGWLVDRWRQDEPETAPPAPVGKYTGDPKEAFWFFDGELARAAEEFQAFQLGKKAQLLGYVQDGKVVEQNPRTHQQVTLHFLPLGDGISFKLAPTFIDTVPEGRPEWWTGLPKDSPVEHGSGPIAITRICGPVVKTGPDTWAIQFYRMGMDNGKRSNDIWFFASHPGDADYKRSVQQAEMHFPIRNTAGTAQHIVFPPIPDQRIGTKSLKLMAKSDAGVPVHYYVREGPAEIDGDTLKFTPIPPRSRLPVKVTIVAWQYGRSADPKLQTAEPVERTFSIGTGADVDRSAVAARWAKATEAVRAVEAAKASAAQRAVEAARNAPDTIGVNFCESLGMRPSDLAGAEARVGNWNNLEHLAAGATVTLDKVVDKNGNPVPGMTVAVTGGATPKGTFDGSRDEKATANDARMFNGMFDGDQGVPTVVEVTHIPFSRYDVYFYRGDDGDQRAGSFKIGHKELTIRGGEGNPSEDGEFYVPGGNYVKFENLGGSTLEASFTAVGAGDAVMRNKVVGFQIVERR